jgi:hypothetical protein
MQANFKQQAQQVSARPGGSSDTSNVVTIAYQQSAFEHFQNVSELGCVYSMMDLASPSWGDHSRHTGFCFLRPLHEALEPHIENITESKKRDAGVLDDVSLLALTSLQGIWAMSANYQKTPARWT